ncbi:hypothetical protein AK830_g1894 [Neonectria ditissima]|uniref:DUF8004 domain-containing protein n=1 Tax=Neonectria ditissima TaxID=78410 RepID=A0A0P7BW15_9HYPO|nr:hypothetical protein AK830_g1894 [Neonectria ditissima]
MSGRSAIARKKKTEAKPRKGSSHGRPASATSSNHDDIPDFPLPPLPTNTGPISPQYLNFQTPMVTPMPDPRYATQGWANAAAPAQPMMMMMGDPRYMAAQQQQPGPPPEDWAYNRSRKTPAIPEESGIEKSGLRSMLDKRSDGVRKGLANAFAFRKKDREDEPPSAATRGSFERPPSAATVRPGTVAGQDDGRAYDRYPHPIQTAAPPMGYPYPNQALPSPPSPQNPWDAKPIGPPPTTKLPPIPQSPAAAAPTIRRWVGAGRPVARWNKLRKDPELWDPNGDVLVFLGRRGQAPKQPPSLRLSSHIIEATESRHLVTLLREGSTEEDLYLPPSPAGYGTHLGLGRDGPLTPPISEEATSLRDELEGQISYEMYFPPPANLNRADQLRHQITTRNVFAVLYHASLVGTSLYHALSDLHTRLDSYMPPGNDNVAQIVKYLSVRGIDDVRSDPATAVSLLAWAESPDVRWEDGWRECFTHCAGMEGELERCPDFKFTTPIARALLERASLETQLRVQAAEERLAEFAYGDMWAASGAAATGPARAAADRLQEMLQSHYTRAYGSWPPAPSQQSSRPGSSRASDGDGAGDEMWLTRTVAMALQRDFGALYDYLVDRDIVWDVSEARSGRKWMMASESGNMGFDADSAEVPMTDILIEFDNKLRFPHVPHPYPLIPESIPPTITATATAGGLFKYGKKAEPSSGGAGSRVGAVERRVQLAYTESTNIYALGSDFVQSDLVDAFVRFEKSDRVGELDPAVARRGRWVLLYGVLQTLASVAVDDERVRHHAGVGYHLGPRLKGTRVPPWKKRSRADSGGVGAGAHERSHCWVVPQSWGGSSSGRGSEAEADEDDEADGYDEYEEYYGTREEEEVGRGGVRPMMGGGGGSRSGSSSGQTRRSGRERGGSGRATAAGWQGNDAPRRRQSVESFITAL